MISEYISNQFKSKNLKEQELFSALAAICI